MDDMKAALKAYFGKLINYNMKHYKKNPTVCYSDELNKLLLTSNVDQDGNVEWLPFEQKKNSALTDIEKTVGVVLCDELKSYYSSYLFLTLEGKYENVYLYFQAISSADAIKRIIIQQQKDGLFYFPNSYTFLLGNAVIKNNDGFLIFLDNQSSKVFCYEPDRKEKHIFQKSLANIISEMEIIT